MLLPSSSFFLTEVVLMMSNNVTVGLPFSKRISYCSASGAGVPGLWLRHRVGGRVVVREKEGRRMFYCFN